MRSVGSILKRSREKKEISLSEASEALKIHPRFLKALEDGNYRTFAHSLHIKGFLKNYAEFLELDVLQVLAFWRREYKEATRPVPIRDVTKPLKTPRIVITPAVLVSSLTLILIAAFLGYLFWQYRSIAGPPTLKVLSPKKDIVVSDPQITLRGIADPQSQLEINGQKVPLGENGDFSFEFILSDGTNILKIVAENEFGKKTEVKRLVVYEKPKLESPPVYEASPSATTETTSSASPP